MLRRALFDSEAIGLESTIDIATAIGGSLVDLNGLFPGSCLPGIDVARIRRQTLTLRAERSPIVRSAVGPLMGAPSIDRPETWSAWRPEPLPRGSVGDGRRTRKRSKVSERRDGCAVQIGRGATGVRAVAGNGSMRDDGVPRRSPDA